MAKGKAIASSQHNLTMSSSAARKFSFRGKTCVVTGGSTGIGREIALRLAASGANVCVVGRSKAALERTKRDSGKKPLHVYLADLLDCDRIQSTVAEIQRDHGRVDILINVAGVWHDERRAYVGRKLWAIKSSELDEVLDVGLRAALQLTRAVLKDMVRQRSGKIVFVSCAFDGPQEATGWLHYYVANQAIEAACKGLAVELRGHGIQANCVAPSFVATPAVKRFFPKEAKRALAPSEVADAALFLASDEADTVTGQVVQLRSKRER